MGEKRGWGRWRNRPKFWGILLRTWVLSVRPKIFLGVILGSTAFNVSAQGYQPEFGLGAYYRGREQADRETINQQQIIQNQLEIVRQAKQLERDKAAREADLAAREAAQRNREAQLRELLNDPAALYRLGVSLIKDGRAEQAFEVIKRSSELSYAPSDIALGMMFETGAGAPKQDLAQAYSLYRRAAVGNNNAFAQYKVGMFLLFGVGVGRDAAAGVDWLKRSANQENLDAQVSLANAYFTGVGVNKDLAEAFRWSQKPAYQGNAIAQYIRGAILTQGCRGQRKNKQEASFWLTKAAQSGHVDAEIALAKLK